MLVVLSPAKRLDWAETAGIPQTEPAFRDAANVLAAAARKLSKPALERLMGISADLATLNKTRFAAFSDTPAPEATRPAVRAFAGDTYAGLEAKSLDPEELAWAQDHLRILSGLYGLLRPFDAIQPYRLEMGTRLRTRAGGTLYDFWGDRLAQALNRAASEAGTGVLVNCASLEYFAAVPEGALNLRIVTPVFLEERADGPRIVSFFAKKARGAMARFIVQNRLVDPDTLTAFDTGGYAYDAGLSGPDRPVFLRRAEASGTV